MEQERDLTHPADDRLASFWAGTLSPDSLEQLAAHVDRCTTCEARLEAVEPAFSQFRRSLEQVHARIPRSPRPESDLWKKMLQIEARRAPRRRVAWRPAWVSGIAAALAGVALLLLPHMGESELRADTLLQQAQNAPAPVRSSRHLRIRTRSASFERPPVLTAEAPERRDEAAVRARFAGAHYNWDDPLSARSFAEWRHSLQHKTSKVTALRGAAGQPEQSVDTRTDNGALREAALTLDAKLLPVSAWFRFADQEWVEIATEPGSSADSLPSLTASPAPPVPPAIAHESRPAEPLAGRELSVRLAIDALQAGPGEPIEVSADPTGAILVTTYGLAPELETKLRASLDRIEDVTLRPAGGPDKPQTGAPRDREPMDRALSASQDVSFEAHLLAELAGRFEPSTEAQLTAPDKARLWDLRMKHAVELTRDLTRLRRELERQRPDFRPVPSAAPHGAQIESIAASATVVDRLVTVLYEGAAPEAEQATAWRQLAAELGSLQPLAGSYGGYVEQHRKELP
jgi:hypothetical protein